MATDKECAIVTGGARGIGLAIVRRLALRGINVLIADIRDELGREMARTLAEEFKVEVVYHHADMTKEDDIKGMVDAAIQRWGRLDWAANNAGTGELLEDHEDHMTGADFDRLYELDQRGVWLCQKYEAAAMRKQPLRIAHGSSVAFGAVEQRGAIVNIASICGHVAIGMPSYTAAKHAVIGITKTGGLFYGKFGIRCNSISPGTVHTPEFFSWSKTFENDPRFAEQASGWSNRCPLHRPSSCEEQANVVSFLLSGESSFINCADIKVDGGLTAVADK
ncbi:hypothetical protein AYO21_06890 [Fonsecaea monophora]|uniref:Uncharacterized protein n=1 Tax=Fonsecaea monophora TaxID=254056 RepID=A0A177F6B9_9EURO|nr:hypothetical protein AYO21_06890 [Fonsecaea monophora]KAH0841229.1 Levodione reductase [Fonsecaea pedrosoi]OAG38859.1 hypothetical protein AYO21_06890 [Fonsecaea monophora]